MTDIFDITKLQGAGESGIFGLGDTPLPVLHKCHNCGQEIKDCVFLEAGECSHCGSVYWWEEEVGIKVPRRCHEATEWLDILVKRVSEKFKNLQED